MAESLIQFKIDSDLKNKYKGRLMLFSGRTMKQDLLEYIKNRVWILDPANAPKPEAVEHTPDSASDTIEALEREYVRLEGCEDEISGIYVEEFGYVEPGDPEYPEALRKRVEELRGAVTEGTEGAEGTEGPENEDSGTENEDSEPENEVDPPTRPPEDPNESFGFPDDEPEPAVTAEPDGDIPPRASLPLPLDPEDEPEPEPETSDDPD